MNLRKYLTIKAAMYKAAAGNIFETGPKGNPVDFVTPEAADGKYDWIQRLADMTRGGYNDYNKHELMMKAVDGDFGASKNFPAGHKSYFSMSGHKGIPTDYDELMDIYNQARAGQLDEAAISQMTEPYIDRIVHGVRDDDGNVGITIGGPNPYFPNESYLRGWSQTYGLPSYPDNNENIMIPKEIRNVQGSKVHKY